MSSLAAPADLGGHGAPGSDRSPPGEADLAAYTRAVARLDALIEATPAPLAKSAAAIRERAELRLARVRRFLALLGDPHLAYPVIHVGGTSGKGSTSTAIAAMLTAAGYRTGLHTSPYLQAATEKLQIDGSLIAPRTFAGLVDELLAAHQTWLATGEEPLTYGEIWIGLLATYFAHERVTVAVIEVGAGGRFDLTNVVSPAVSVITSIGLDHTVTLGATIPEIAWHKAGIIKRGAPAVIAVTDPAALGPILAEVAATGASPRRVIPGDTDSLVAAGPNDTTWHERATGQEWTIALAGSFQVANGATAVAAIRALVETTPGFTVPDAAIRAGLAATRIPGRCETVGGEPRVLLDGAHNPEKMAALAAALPTLAPVEPGRRRIAVLGVLEAKEHAAMLAALAPRIDELIATSPQVLAKPSAAAGALAATAREIGFTGPITIEPEPGAALERALSHAGAGDRVLVTGSLYLVGNVRERWFPTAEIVRQRTPWPVPPLTTETEASA